MTQKELAKHLGVSEGYLSLVKNGYRRPGKLRAESWRPVTRRTYAWWLRADTAAIQRLLNRIQGGGNGTN